MFEKDIGKLEKELGFTFKNRILLIEAITHKSFSKSEENNQRLEFLGDSILNTIISEYLFDEFGHDNEGKMTSMRASLVNENSLYELAKKIKLNNFMLMSEEEILRKGNLRKAALSDTFEAIIGAIFLDQGYDKTKIIVTNLFNEELKNLNNVKTFKDPKSELQESLQSMKIKPPKYITSVKSGPPHNPVFETKLFIGNKLINRSEGFKKSDSEKKVATDTLKMLENNMLEITEEKSLLKKIIDSLIR